MNHIHRLTQERDEARAALRETERRLSALMAYLCSDKFANDDYVHVRTDMLPRISEIKQLVNCPF
jgi:hypothetical protein